MGRYNFKSWQIAKKRKERNFYVRKQNTSGGGGRSSRLAKLINLKDRAIALALSVITAISAFAGLDLTAFAADTGWAIVPIGILDGTVTADRAKGMPGDKVTLTITPDPGYELAGIFVQAIDSGTYLNITVSPDELSATFTMPDQIVKVRAFFREVGSDEYNIVELVPTGGEITKYLVNGSPGRYAAAGDEVTLQLKPDAGYELTSLYVVKTNGTVPVNIAQDKLSATFTMPNSAVYIRPEFEREKNVYDGSPVDIKITVELNGYPAGTVIDWLSTEISYTYDEVDPYGTIVQKTANENHIQFVEDSYGVFVGTGNLSHTVSTRPGKDEIKITYKHTIDNLTLTVPSRKTYTTEQINVGCRHGNSVPPEIPAVTPDWERARIYCFNDPEYDNAEPLAGTIYDLYEGAHPDIDLKSVQLYANGGQVESVVGTKYNTKTKQLTLWETFTGVDAGTYDSTTSKQIAWIVTKDDKCPNNMKQKSDNSVVKVSKGKITAIAPGVAYVWACRVHPDDPTSVSTTESARVRVIVGDAPSKVVLTHEIPDDENATVVPIQKEELGVGEMQQIYIYMKSKTEKIDSSQWRIEVTKGSEYLAVSYDGGANTFSNKTVKPFKGDQHASFFIKGLGIKPDGKTTTAEVTLTNLYTGKKTKLRVTISNSVVQTIQPSRSDRNLSDLVVTSQRTKMSYALSHKTLNNYYMTSAQMYLTGTNSAKYAALIDSPTSDKPQIIVTSDTDVTREMIFKDTKSGLQINFTGTRSKTVTAKWETGFLKMDVKKDAAAEKGNIIIIFNKSHDMNGVLIVPYQVTSADPDNTPAA